MAYADIVFKQNLEEILKKPWKVDNRAKWKDGSTPMTKSKFPVINQYDLSKEFPILTLRQIYLKSCFREIKWIYIDQSNNVNDLGLRIWDSWADENGSIGKAYGYQVAKKMYGYPSQIDYVLNEIKRNPTSRRLVIELWNVDDIEEMALPPCAHHIQFNVEDGRLNAIFKQRSQDFLVANNWNVVQYALLMHMVARHCGLEVGELTHVIGDCHIYDRHIEQAYELLRREPKPAPKLIINDKVKNFYDFTEDDFELVDYQYCEPQLYFEVAI